MKKPIEKTILKEALKEALAPLLIGVRNDLGELASREVKQHQMSLEINGEKVALLKGEKGDKGDTVIGPKGEKGDKGDSIKGEQGPTGHTPVFGKDFWTKEQQKAFAHDILVMATPTKGIHYFDGLKGEKGDNGKDGTDGTEISAVEIRKKLEELKGKSRLKIKAIAGLEEALAKAMTSGGMSSIGGSGGGVSTETDPIWAIDKPNYLKLDQTTPQSVINGAPLFKGGLKAGSSDFFSVDTDGDVVTRNLTADLIEYVTNGSFDAGSSGWTTTGSNPSNTADFGTYDSEEAVRLYVSDMPSGYVQISQTEPLLSAGDYIITIKHKETYAFNPSSWLTVKIGTNSTDITMSQTIVTQSINVSISDSDLSAGKDIKIKFQPSAGLYAYIYDIKIEKISVVTLGKTTIRSLVLNSLNITQTAVSDDTTPDNPLAIVGTAGGNTSKVGSNAPNGGSSSLTLGKGGDSYGTNSDGGVGGAFSRLAGNGGVKLGGNGTCGAGGDITDIAGDGGANTQGGSGGAGGSILRKSGKGGNAIYSNTSNDGGSITDTVGASGSITNSILVYITPKAGNHYYNTAGDVGVLTSSASASTNISLSAGGSQYFTGGKGGNVVFSGTYTGTATGAKGGGQVLVGGQGSSLSSVIPSGVGIAGDGGDVILDGGLAGTVTGFATNTAGNSGNIILGGTRGKTGIGVTSPTAMLHLKAGTTTANTAPLKFTNGNNLTTAEAGAIEYDGTQLYFSPSTTRNALIQDNGTRLTSGRVPFATTNGYLIDDADMTFATDTLTVTKIVGSTSVKVGTAAGFISSDGSTGATGSFTTADSKTVTVKDGIITSIV